MTPETQRQHSVRDAVIGIVLFAALLVLAVLQYRWIGQVSEADGNRLRNELRTTLGRFTSDVDSELERLVRVLSGSANRGPTDGETDEAVLKERLETWRDFALHPPLVKSAWLAEDPDLPEALRPLAARLPGNVSDLRGGRGSRFPTIVDAAVPAFGVLRWNWQSDSIPERLSWFIVQLDMDYVKKEWLPDLVSKDFGSEFHVRVFRPSTGETLYETPSKLQSPAEEEAAESLFTFRNAGGRGRGGPPDRFKGFGGPPEPGKRQQSEVPPGPLSGNGGPLPSDPFRGDPSPRGDPGPRPDSGWRAEVSFQQGSTAELVANLRFRNLAVSFGILLLMGVSIAMLMLSSRRANALARQQMEFVAGVTHELRTPLAVILSASQNLADGVTAEGSRVRRYGGVIHGQTKRLAGMVEQVLRFAGLSSQHGELQLAPVNVQKLIHEAITDCRPDLQSSGARLTVTVGEDMPPIEGDRAALLHALRNLLSNAAKHGAGADVRLNAAVNDQGRIELAVEDDGPGVEPGDLPHLFEPFYRGQRAKHDQVHGSGLGLSLVKKIVDAHQGTIEATSLPGQGISFRMTLPVAKVG